MTKTEAKKLRKKHRCNDLVSVSIFMLTTIVLALVSAEEHISTVALTLATIAFLGAIANILYVWWRDSKEWEEAKRNGHNGNDR